MLRGTILRRSVAILLLAAFCLCSACKAEKKEEKNSIRIGVCLYRSDDTFINNVRAELEKRVKEYELETGARVTLDFQDAKGNQSTQNSQVERLISLGCDALIVNLVDRMDASGVIDRVSTAEIPTVFFNRQPVEEDMNRWDRLYYVGSDAKESAVLEGGMIADHFRNTPEDVDPNGDGVISYVLLEGESSHQDSLIRTEWSIQTLKDAGVPVERLAGGIANWERTQASALMEQWLNQYPEQIEVVISNNDDMALGAVDALERADIDSVFVVGIDGTTPALDAIARGRLAGTVQIDLKQYARVLFAIAMSEVTGEEIPDTIELTEGKYYMCPQRVVEREAVRTE
ncbi:MAG: galactose ABC transporter substrate-binding protein [Clostridiales bacterium]|nr:galactose ABC transporter substrate-binding protein [Clostridiales bacterium]